MCPWGVRRVQVLKPNLPVAPSHEHLRCLPQSCNLSLVEYDCALKVVSQRANLLNDVDGVFHLFHLPDGLCRIGVDGHIRYSCVFGCC